MKPLKKALLNYVLIVMLAGFLSVHNTFGQKANAPVFYNIAGKDISKLSAWSSLEDGSGSQPRSFSANGATWYIIHNANLMNKVAITGRGSKIVVTGDENKSVRLTLLPDSELNALVEVQQYGLLNILSDRYPRLGIMHPGSTVTFSLDEKVIPYHDYFNLVLVETNPVFDKSTNPVIRIHGSLTLRGNVKFPEPADAEYSLHFTGPWFQVIQTDKNVLRAFNISIEKTSGEMRIQRESKISAYNMLVIELEEDAVLDDNGSVFYAGAGISLRGTNKNLNLTGTMVLAGKDKDALNTHNSGSQYVVSTAGVDLPNIIVKGNNHNGEYIFRNTAGDTLEFRGSFFVDGHAGGHIRFDNKVKFQGEYSVSDDFKGTIAPFEKIGGN
jgi:hypothetical protein